MALYIGLMSGTSLDGVDAALVALDSDGDRVDARLEAFHFKPYGPQQRRAIRAAIAGGVSEICRLNAALGEWLADAALELLAEAGLTASTVVAVGSHGQTVWHEPSSAEDRRGATLQIGDAAVLAERLGIPVISDFRARDVAAGGQGAPLVPLVDRLLFQAPQRYRALQNIGGIANVTLVPPAGSAEPLIAFDTGPGMAVIDAVVERVTDGEETYDPDGRHAAAGTPSPELVSELVEDDYLVRGPPKTTGRERYGDEYADRLLARGAALGVSGAHLIATATALTARTIADAHKRFLYPIATPGECLVSGGGARNPTLMRMLEEQLAPVPVRDTGSVGWDPDAKEAAAFAVLAHLFQARRPGNVPSATGAIGPRILGKLTPP